MTTNASVSAAVPSRRRYRLPIVVGAALAAVVVYVVAVPILGIDVAVPEAPGSDIKAPLDLIAVVAMGLISSLLGWFALAVLERFTGGRALTVWTVLALAVLVLSLPYLPGWTVAERIVVGLMHVTLGVVLIGGMRWTCAADE